MAGLKYEKMAKTGIHVSVQQNRWIKKSFGRNSHGEVEGRTTGNLFHRGGGDGGVFMLWLIPWHLRVLSNWFQVTPSKSRRNNKRDDHFNKSDFRYTANELLSS